MKKIQNAPEDVVDSTLAAFARVHADLVRAEEPRLALRATPLPPGQVALVSGGGSGHEPLHAGFVGDGMLAAAVLGDVFASPTSEQVEAAARAVDAGGGVLLLVKNYTGDKLNFRVAAELLEDRGIPSATVLVADDAALPADDNGPGRRGTGATVFVEKIAGAAAHEGATLAEVAELARRVADRSRSIGFALTSCTTPMAGRPTFSLGEDEVEFGVGIHGERGQRTQALTTSAELAEQMVEVLAGELAPDPTSPLLVFTNGLGATPATELYPLHGDVLGALERRGLTPARHLVGSYVTSLDMAGASLSLLVLDDELLRLWDAPVRTPALTWGAPDAGPPPERPVDRGAAVASRSDETVSSQSATEPSAPDPGPQQSSTSTADRSPDTGSDALIDAALVRAWMSTAAVLLHEAVPHLTELDAARGDADHGVNMERGFRAISEELEGDPPPSAELTLTAAAAVLRRVMGGTTGPLWASALRRAGKALGAAEPAPADAVADALFAAAEAVAEVGEAEEGDNTMLDALLPAARALREALAEGRDLAAALDSATQAAEGGAAATADRAATRGRASYVGDRAIGSADPGATSAAIVIAALRDSVAART